MAKKKSNKKLSDSNVAGKVEKENPFELKYNKKKKNVIGIQHSKRFEKGFPGVSKLKAIEKRKNSLLQDYKKSKRSNRFVDKRIGENENDMSVEDKMMARFAAERRKNRVIGGLLNDDEDLTHHGHTLATVEKFDAPFSDSEDDEVRLKGDYVSSAHFGGGFFTKKDEESSEKTREEVISEIVAKSKERKELRQKEKEISEELTEQLNDKFKEIHKLMPALMKTKKVEEVSTDYGYDAFLRELRMDQSGKAQASTSLKALEAMARKQKILNEKLEKDMLKRMQIVDPYERKAMKHRSADDSDDGFELDSDDERERQKKAKLELLKTKEDEEEDEEGSENDESKTVTKKKEETEETVLETINNFIELCRREKDSSSNENTEEEVLILGEKKIPFSETIESLYESVKKSPLMHSKVLLDIMKRKSALFTKFCHTKLKSKRILFDLVTIFKLVGLLYPTSDFRHPVTNVATLLMTDTLMKLNHNYGSHVHYGLYICSLFSEYTELSKRYVPECFMFLSSIFTAVTNKLLPSNSTPEQKSIRWKVIGDCAQFLVPYVNNLQLWFYGKTLEMITKSADQLLALEMPKPVKDKLTTLLGNIRKENRPKRRKLVQDDSRRFKVKLLEPKLLTKEHKKQNSEKKLIRQHRKEMKGAKREIRKDNYFLASQHMKEQHEKDMDRKRKVKKLYHDIATESGYYKKLESKKSFK